MRNKKQQAGETVVEYLINIVIVVILAAILLPVFVKARAKARQIDCGQNLRRLHIAFSMYAADHDGFLPPYTNNLLHANETGPDTKALRKHSPPSAPALAGALLPYTRSNAVWFCKDDSLAHQNTLALHYPAGLLIDHRYGSYDMAWWMGLAQTSARMNGISSIDSQGKLVPMNPATEEFLKDEEIQQSGCGDWLYSHRNWFNTLYLDGHVKAHSVKCAP